MKFCEWSVAQSVEVKTRIATLQGQWLSIAMVCEACYRSF